MIEPVITVKNLTMAYGQNVLQKDLSFTINRSDIFIIMGGSGCGKSTLLRHLIGLKRPAKGSVLYGDVDFWQLDDQQQGNILQRAGILYQSSALWSSMTLAENVALPLQQYSSQSLSFISELVEFKLSLVGLGGFGSYYPAELSGGMRKRAALARAIAYDPEFLFFDEPSAGLDPISAKNLDDLILEIRDSLGATVVIVTHELASIFSIGTNSVFLDSDSKTMLGTGHPRQLLDSNTDNKIINFLTRGKGRKEADLE
jgi:phospholipid/cholesterol/gamma-HCH transport system ATP-binding protein